MSGKYLRQPRRRDEIIRAARLCAEEVLKDGGGKIGMEEFEKHLYSSGIPDPDLIIRPGRAAAFKLSAVSVGIFGAVLYRHAVA